MNFKASLMVVAMLGLTGCSLIPEYQRPSAPVPADWQAAGDLPGEVQLSLAGWRDYFQDPQLQTLIASALEHNRDLRVAALNVEAYRALYRVQRAERLPELSASGSGTRTRLPASLSAGDQAMISSQYSATLDVAWELDLFGRIASLSEQALEEYLATEQARRGVHTALVASVATAYLTWQADQNLLQLAEETVANYQQSYDLIALSQREGIASTLELAQSRAALESARAAVAQYQRQVAQDRNALARLVGQGQVLAPLASRNLEAVALPTLPADLSSEVLLQRPDVRQAEHRLLAANASIGAARAAFFPSIRLTGAAGTASNELSGLFDGGSGYWNFAPSISLPIFNAGRLRANLDYAELSRDTRVAEYEATLQEAFREVADALAAREGYGAQLQARQALVEANEQYYRLAEQRYRGGVESHLTLLDAQRELFNARQQWLSEQLALLSSEVDLFRALGGGWLETSNAQEGAG
ncbi:multidrug transporter [Pseudomonas sp. WN033]|nr:multidrug transporter [Pseudomonas sp. WN033]